MNTPPFLLGAALLFWGWETGLLWAGVAAALVAEGSRVVSWRWAFTEEDFGRIWTLCVTVFVGIMASQGLTASSGSEARVAVHKITMWAPLTVLPLVLAQLYSEAGAIPAGVFLRSLRRRTTPASPLDAHRVSLSYPFAMLCMLAAAPANDRSPWFYLAICALTAWTLWSFRSRAVSLALWAGLFIMAGGLGYAGHVGLHRLQVAVEDQVIRFLSGRAGGQTDPYRTHTVMGAVGLLKLSDSIALRVELPSGTQTPLLLRQAAYNQYQSSLPSDIGTGKISRWFAAGQAQMEGMQPEQDGTTWTFQRTAAAGPAMTIASPMPKGKGVLALPADAAQVERLPVGEMKRNRLGAVRAAEGPEFVFYRINRAPEAARDEPPDANDLVVPPNEAPVIAQIVADLRLKGRPPREQLAVIERYFSEQFGYTTYQPNRPPGGTPVADFLLRTKSGHCEFFATATVLLLRAAGTPARYAVGYSVQEFSPLENQHIVRDRHAHAWAIAYIDGAWRDVDMTPPSWFRIEQGQASWWKPAQDLWAWLMFQIDKWRWSEQRPAIADYLVWLLIPLFAALGYRIYRSKRVTRAGTQAARGPAAHYPGADSDFYAIERRLAELSFPRQPAESLPAWLDRLRASRVPAIRYDALPALIQLHYRYRFDPNGLGEAERRQLASRTQSWLSEHRTRA
jgi:hypothetical protein